VIASKARREHLGLLLQLRRIFRQPFCERGCLLETTPLLHAQFPFLFEEGGSAILAFSSPIDANGRAVVT
jgi:hypothetical protein